jgi:two-component system chemotaxis sensor kinase CheA
MTRKNEDTFLREGTEQITELNNALLALEEDPDDGEVMDSCFRYAHTLKSNFAAQGYGDASELAHAMEDVLDDVREGDQSVEPDLMDQLFAGVDALEGRLDEIADGEEPSGDAAELVARLRAWGSDGEDTGDGEDPAAGDRFERLESALEGGSVARASVELADSEVPGADGMLVLERLADRFDVVETDPPTDVVHAGEHDGHVDVFVEGADEAAVREVASGLQPVEAVALTTVSDVDFDNDVPAIEGGDADSTEAGADDTPEVADGEPDERSADEDGSDGEPAPADEETDDASTATPGIAGRLWSGLVGLPGLLAGAVALGGSGGDGSTTGTAQSTASDGGSAATGRADDADGQGANARSQAPGGEVPASGTTPGRGGGEAPDTGSPVDGEPSDAAGLVDGEAVVGQDVGAAVDDISTVRVDVERLDELYGLVERLVTSRIKLRNTFEEAGVDPGRDLEELDKTTNSLQDTVMEMRLVPMDRVVERFPRVVRDLARDQDKEVSLELSGTDVELDRRILDRVSDPLVHLLRNAVDHGIEPPAEREAADKPREGTVSLSARRQRDTVTITIADDGRGIDPEEVRETALENGIRTERELDAMDDSAVYDLVFHPGFSTSDEVTEVSGRGVGMDVVYNTVSRLDGSVSVDSTPGEGTEVTLRLPVSVAIVKVLFVRVGGDRFGIPIKKIARVTHFEDVETVNGTELFEYEDGLAPVVRLHEALDTVSGPSANGDGMLVRIQESERPVALYCDEIVDYEEVVVKPLDGVLSGTPGLGGTAVLGEGDVVPVLDVMTI